jgi:uncharacterized protein (TIRG00374 family)
MSIRAKNIILFAIVACSIAYLYLKRSSLENLKNISISELLVLLITSSIGLAVYGYGYKKLLEVFGIDLHFKEWFGLTACNAMFNYYVPAKGGTVARAYYLQRHYGLKYSYYASLTAAAYLICLVLFSTLGLAALLLNFFLRREFSIILGLILLICFAASILLAISIRFFFSAKKGTGIKKLDRLMQNIREGLAYFSKDRSPALYFGLYTGAYLLIMSARLFLCFHFLDVKLNFIHALMIRSMTQFSFLVSLIPGNLGIKEGLIVFLSGEFQISSDQAVLAALIDRVVAMMVVFGLGFIFSRMLLSRMDRS